MREIKERYETSKSMDNLGCNEKKKLFHIKLYEVIRFYFTYLLS